jgi:hypothetical protein
MKQVQLKIHQAMEWQSNLSWRHDARLDVPDQALSA